MFVIMLRNISFIPDTIHIYPYLIMNLVFRYRFINSSKKAEVYESTVFLECRSDYDSVDHYLFIRNTCNYAALHIAGMQWMWFPFNDRDNRCSMCIGRRNENKSSLLMRKNWIYRWSNLLVITMIYKNGEEENNDSLESNRKKK